MNKKVHVACIFNCLSKMKDFLRSQPVTYTINVVIYQKQCNIESLLLQTTNRK